MKGEWKVGHCVYILKCVILTKDGYKTVWKIGRTNDLNRRGMEHYHGFGGFEEIVHQQMCPNCKYLEDCVLMRLGLDRIDTETVVSKPEEAIEAINRCMIARDFICADGKCPETDEEEHMKCLVGDEYCQDFAVQKDAQNIYNFVRKNLRDK